MRLVGSIVLVLLACAPAYAQHDHAAEEDHHGHGDGESANAFRAGVSLVAASYDQTLYAGNYQGVLPVAGWTNGRFSVHASGSVYRIDKNGAAFYGAGDAGLHGSAQLVQRDAFAAGIVVGAMFPVGNEQHGMGMGHLMVMPALFGGWTASRLHVGASVGYSRALGGESHADHGMVPIVEPMNMSEVSWSAAADVHVAAQVVAGARGSGGFPVGHGAVRAMVGGRVAWQARRVESAFELQAGVAGDPFTLRGVVSTALSF